MYNNHLIFTDILDATTEKSGYSIVTFTKLSTVSPINSRQFSSFHCYTQIVHEVSLRVLNGNQGGKEADLVQNLA